MIKDKKGRRIFINACWKTYCKRFRTSKKAYSLYLSAYRKAEAGHYADSPDSTVSTLIDYVDVGYYGSMTTFMRSAAVKEWLRSIRQAYGDILVLVTSNEFVDTYVLHTINDGKLVFKFKLK